MGLVSSPMAINRRNVKLTDTGDLLYHIDKPLNIRKKRARVSQFKVLSFWKILDVKSRILSAHFNILITNFIVQRLDTPRSKKNLTVEN